MIEGSHKQRTLSNFYDFLGRFYFSHAILSMRPGCFFGKICFRLHLKRGYVILLVYHYPYRRQTR